MEVGTIQARSRKAKLLTSVLWHKFTVGHGENPGLDFKIWRKSAYSRNLLDVSAEFRYKRFVDHTTEPETIPVDSTPEEPC